MKVREKLSLMAAFASVIITFVAIAHLPMGWALAVSYTAILLALLSVDIDKDDKN